MKNIKQVCNEVIEASEEAKEFADSDFESAAANDVVQEYFLLAETQAPKLAKALLVMQEALEKIKDGGVPLGVVANVTERMLSMSTIAADILVEAENLLGGVGSERVHKFNSNNHWCYSDSNSSYLHLRGNR